MPWSEALIAAKTRKISPTEGRVLSYAEALNEALRIAMEMDPKVFVLGQGVDDPAASFGVTRGLQEKFGPERVFDVPLSEEAMTGVCVGSAMTGCRPVMTHNRPDFVLLSMNQLVTHAAKLAYLDVGKSRAPMVIWAAIGRGWGSGAQHSQAIQGMLLGVPGLKLVMPSTPADAKGLMLAAVADDNPVVVFEHRWLMREQGVVPEGFYTVPLGQGVYRRRGGDLTIAGSSHALALALDAVDALADEGIQADVIDLRSLKPLDEAILFESIEKTGRLLVVDTGWAMGGVCAEIACLVAEKRFTALRGPVRRVGLPDVPTPAGYTLEQHFYPDVERMKREIRALCA
jgi:pyruvate dehydrogenase E1 component beta subunit